MQKPEELRGHPGSSLVLSRRVLLVTQFRFNMTADGVPSEEAVALVEHSGNRNNGTDGRCRGRTVQTLCKRPLSVGAGLLEVASGQSLTVGSGEREQRRSCLCIEP